MTDPGTEIMTVRDVSRYLKIAESTVYRLAQTGELPGRKIGGMWRFSKHAIDVFVTQQAPESPPSALPGALGSDERQ